MTKKGNSKSAGRPARDSSTKSDKHASGALSADERNALKSLAIREKKRVDKEDEEHLFKRLQRRMAGKKKGRRRPATTSSDSSSSDESSSDEDDSPKKGKSKSAKRATRKQTKLAKVMEENSALKAQAEELRILKLKSEAALQDTSKGSDEPSLSYSQWKKLVTEANSESLPNTPSKKDKPTLGGILAKHISFITASAAEDIVKMLDTKLQECEVVQAISKGKKNCSKLASRDIRTFAKECTEIHFGDSTDVATLVALKTKYHLETTACKANTVVAYILEMCLSRSVDVTHAELGIL